MSKKFDAPIVLSRDGRDSSKSQKLVLCSSLDSDMKHYDSVLRKGESLVKSKCKSELEKLEKAQRKFEKKLQDVMKSDEMIALHDEAENASKKASLSFTKVEKEIVRQQEKIKNDMTLDSKSKKNELVALQDAAVKEYSQLAEKYPAALRAQMLTQLQTHNVVLLQ